ncbi:MAG: hypothetical protein CM15mP45_01840 [Deltaproteobacteria bacterium]|nr:MAG: hypothetical protein CM15mP45_01840 [Deltaproteobacteria bacterium]
MIVTDNLKLAMETAERVEAGYVWINSTGRYLGAPYGVGNKVDLVKKNALMNY